MDDIYLRSVIYYNVATTSSYRKPVFFEVIVDPTEPYPYHL